MTHGRHCHSGRGQLNFLINAGRRYVSPLLLLLSIAVLYMIWGVVGMLLAVPLVTTVKIILSHFDNTRYIAKLMSDD